MCKTTNLVKIMYSTCINSVMMFMHATLDVNFTYRCSHKKIRSDTFLTDLVLRIKVGRQILLRTTVI